MTAVRPSAGKRMTTSPTASNQMQERVFAFLADPVQHPEMHRIDTHAASVFLVGDRALKIKRAVRFPYLELFDPGEAEDRLRERTHYQPPLRTANLPPRRSDHEKRGWIARDRR